MPSYVTPVKNSAYIMYVGLPSQANTKTFQSNPTVAAGDFTVRIDGATSNNLATLPVSTGKLVKIALSAAEMNGDNITVLCIDQAGAEWCDVIINIQTTTRQIDDLAYPATTGRSFVVDTSGNVNTNLVNIAGSAVNTASAQLGVNVVNAAGTAWGSGAITAASIATDAIGAAELATDAVQEIADALLDRASAVDTYTPRQTLRLLLASQAGKLSVSGATVTIRAVDDSKDRISATTDSTGQRTAVTLTAT